MNSNPNFLVESDNQVPVESVVALSEAEEMLAVGFFGQDFGYPSVIRSAFVGTN